MKAAILLLRGPSEDKQLRACLEYIDSEHWDFKHVIPYWSPETAVALVVAGAIGVVVAACFNKSLIPLANEIGGRGEVWYVHPQPIQVKPARRTRSIAELIRHMRGRGETTQEIAGFFEIDSGEVRRIIRGDGD